MSNLDFLIIDFSSEQLHFHVSKNTMTIEDAVFYGTSLGEGWNLANPRVLSFKDRILLENKLSPLTPMNFWSSLNNNSFNMKWRYGIYVKSAS